MNIRYLGGAAAILGAVLPGSAFAAESWWQASSDHFIVYSQGTQADAQRLAVSLERLDQAERYMAHLKPENSAISTSEKLTVFQFGHTSDIGALEGSEGVAGFFIARAGRSVAFVPLRPDSRGGERGDYSDFDLDPASVIFHEYTHYFMFQHAAGAYPVWYTEGFAELFATLVLKPDGFIFGQAPPYRQYSLAHAPLNIPVLLDPPKNDDALTVDSVYAGGWLMTSYLSLEPSRAGQLGDYLRRINGGENKLKAAREAFGDLSRLTSQIDAYRRGRVRVIEIKFESYKPPQVQSAPVPADIGDAMMLRIRLERGGTCKKMQALVPAARRLVESHPQSGSTLMLAATVEMEAGNLSEAEALGNKALLAGADPMRAHLMLGRLTVLKSKGDPVLLKAARAHYAAANRLDPKNAEALYGFYLGFVLGGQTPNENALIGLDEAFTLAPFDDDIRQTLVWQLLSENREVDARRVFQPLVNTAEASKKSRERWATASRQLDAGDKAGAMATLRPTLASRLNDDEGG